VPASEQVAAELRLASPLPSPAGVADRSRWGGEVQSADRAQSRRVSVAAQVTVAGGTLRDRHLDERDRNLMRDRVAVLVEGGGDLAFQLCERGHGPGHDTIMTPDATRLPAGLSLTTTGALDTVPAATATHQLQGP
jgi:hypothetical protein